MRMIIMILFASLAGYGALQINKIDPDNYVKMYFGNYVVELKVLGFLVLLLAVVLLMYFLLWLVRLIMRSPKSLSLWNKRRNRNKADEQFGAGYLSLIKGDWRKAESQLTNKSDHSHIPYVNYLAAAGAAQEQGRISQRDDYLKAAYEAAPKERLAIALTKASLHQKAGQIEQAQATLLDVESLGKKNPQYTAMLVQAHQQAGDWPRIQQILPLAKKQNALPEPMLVDLQNKVYLNSLTSAQDKTAAWKALPRDQRKRIENVVIYAQTLNQNSEFETAEKLIRNALKSDWSDSLVDIYGQLKSAKPQKLLRVVEGWLMARSDNPHVNLAAGRLAAASQQTDQAKEYLQAAITHGPLPGAYSVMGDVLESNNESGKALQLYRHGLQLFADSNACTEPAAVGQLVEADESVKESVEQPTQEQGTNA